MTDPVRRAYVDVGGGQVHVRTAGAGQALLLLHQTPWSSLQYHRVMAPLARRGFRVFAIDTPGYGLSDALSGEPSILAYADAAAGALDALGIVRAAVAGHHTGAMIAAALAARHPARIAALVTDNLPFYTPDERAARFANPGRTFPIEPDGRHFADRWRFMRDVADPAMSDESVHLAVLTYFNGGEGYGHAAAFRHDVGADLAAIACPTRIIASRTDPLAPAAERIRAVRPDFDYAEFPGGTATMLEDPERWSEMIGGFVARAI